MIPVTVTLSGRRDFADVIELRWGHSGWTRTLNLLTGVLTRRGGFGERNPEDAQRERPCVKLEAADVLWVESQRAAGIACSHRKPGERRGRDPPSEPLAGLTWPTP